ncbi:protein APEM9 [Typha angustifolia]|uniref:protein APEM9 n=1 Tax=Typha angustifolia TaxID=59011 RepID=UPI003C2FE9AD
MVHVSESEIWKQIDDAECCLVHGMFEEAASLASSVIRQVHAAPSEAVVDSIQLVEMIEVAGIMFMQSLEALGRTMQLFVELKEIYGSVPAIPVRFVLAGAMMQINGGFSSNLRAILEDYLAKWRCAEGDVYVLTESEPQTSFNGCISPSVMPTEDYLKVVELYTIQLLGMILHEPDVAIYWIERAELPEHNRQDLLRRLHKLRSAAKPSTTAGEGRKQVTERSLPASAAPLTVDDYPQTSEPHYLSNQNTLKGSHLKSIQSVTGRVDPCFWWFRTVRIKFGKLQLIVPSGKMMLLFSLIFSTLYILRNRTVLLKRVAVRQVSYLLRVLLDAWRLAFSVQMNPLAAVQQLPSAPRGSR